MKVSSFAWFLVGVGLAASVVGCKKAPGATDVPGADASQMSKGTRQTKLGKPLGDLTKEDLVAGLEKAGFTKPTNSVSTSPGVTTTAAYGKKGDLSVSLVLSAWQDPKTRARMKDAKKRDANVAVFEDGDYYVVMTAKEKDAPSAARAKELLAQIIGP
ncbi:MAG: hypothetical protein IT374_18845 [Polyangiaceae bacterium]|nr:hypothetical protein [Polyangiaceae bacterium]